MNRNERNVQKCLIRKIRMQNENIELLLPSIGMLSFAFHPLLFPQSFHLENSSRRKKRFLEASKIRPNRVTFSHSTDSVFLIPLIQYSIQQQMHRKTSDPSVCFSSLTYSFPYLTIFSSHSFLFTLDVRKRLKERKRESSESPSFRKSLSTFFSFMSTTTLNTMSFMFHLT